jgi:PAT family beta-lactamase induction signal transducer AmpG
VAPRLTLLSLLYFCQGLPGGFLAVALPVILRGRGLSMASIGLISLLSLPWVLKVLWAPLVDRWWSPRLGRRRTWMVPAMLGMLGCTLVLSGFDPSTDLFAIGVWFLLLNVFAATQDVAVDGYAVDLLRGRDLGPANSAQVGGFKLGNIVGGGVLLALIGVIGWRGDFWIMAACIGVALLLVLVVREPPPESTTVASTWSITARAFRGVFRQPAFALFLVAAKFGETFGGTPVKPTLVDFDFSEKLIGTIDGIVGGLATVLGAVVAGVLVRRSGWRVAFATMSIAQGVALAVLGLHLEQPEVVGVAVRLAFENFAGGGVAVAVFVLAMSRCSPASGGAEFTAMQVVYMAGAALAAPVAGACADAWGVLPVMIAGATMAIAIGIVAAVRGDRLAPA